MMRCHLTPIRMAKKKTKNKTKQKNLTVLGAGENEEPLELSYIVDGICYVYSHSSKQSGSFL